MVIFGVIIALIIIKLEEILILKKSIILGIGLMIPMIIDGSLQYLNRISSNNLRRAVTGFLFGVGVTIIVNVSL